MKCIKIKDVEMSKTKLTIYQGIYLFSKLAESTAKITSLKIDNNDLSLVPAEYLSKGALTLPSPLTFLTPVLRRDQDIRGGPLRDAAYRPASQQCLPGDVGPVLHTEDCPGRFVECCLDGFILVTMSLCR